VRLGISLTNRTSSILGDAYRASLSCPAHQNSGPARTGNFRGWLSGDRFAGSVCGDLSKDRNGSYGIRSRIQGMPASR